MVAKERIVKERREKRQEDGKTAVLYKAGKKKQAERLFLAHSRAHFIFKRLSNFAPSRVEFGKTRHLYYLRCQYSNRTVTQFRSNCTQTRSMPPLSGSRRRPLPFQRLLLLLALPIHSRLSVNSFATFRFIPPPKPRVSPSSLSFLWHPLSSRLSLSPS